MRRKLSRRNFNRGVVAAVSSVALRGKVSHVMAADSPARSIAPGPFKPTWESLAGGYTCPDWFRDAKFGIWAHWSAQCVPEQGDWYARQTYIQGHAQYTHHLNTYGHPTK